MINDNYKISVVIPTIWASDFIYQSIERLIHNDIIGEIIIIDNNSSNKKILPESDKIRYYDFGRNIYVNPAWNYGVAHSKYRKVCLLNDDVIIDDLAFYYASFELDNENVTLIGAAKSSFDESFKYYELEEIKIRNRGFGICIFLDKEYYVPIPDDLKIWFGDDWLIKNSKKIYRMHGPYIQTEMSTSSEDPSFKNILDEDAKNSLKYELPWSNDYE